MGKGRIEAFSDGVLAIIITIMVLELKVPHGADFEAIRHLAPELTAYIVSFVYVAIYWNNHHHLMHLVKRVNGWILWANMHLLFWLSLVPVTTHWIGEHPHEVAPGFAYGVVLFMAGISWLLLQRAIINAHGGVSQSELARAIGADKKGKLSGIAYLAALGLAFVDTYLSIAIYVAMAVVWVVPDRRITRALAAHE